MASKQQSPRKQPTAREMPSAGNAKATVAGKSSQDKVMVEFLLYMAGEVPELSAVWGVIWEKVPEKYLADRKIWGYLASFIAEVKVIDAGSKNAGELYDLETAHGKWTGLIDTARKRCAGSDNPQTVVRA